jgi:hypothetical protein
MIARLIPVEIGTMAEEALDGSSKWNTSGFPDDLVSRRLYSEQAGREDQELQCRIPACRNN